MSEEDKIDRTIKNAAIQHELQRQYDAIERKVYFLHIFRWNFAHFYFFQNFRERAERKPSKTDLIGDSAEMNLVLNHSAQPGTGKPSQITSLYQKYLFLAAQCTYQ